MVKYPQQSQNGKLCTGAKQRDLSALTPHLTLPLFCLNFLLSSFCCRDSHGKSGYLVAVQSSFHWTESSIPFCYTKCEYNLSTSCKLALSQALVF